MNCNLCVSSLKSKQQDKTKTPESRRRPPQSSNITGNLTLSDIPSSINNRISRITKTDRYILQYRYLALFGNGDRNKSYLGTGRSRCIFINSTKTGRWKTPGGRRPDARNLDYDQEQDDDDDDHDDLFFSATNSAHLQMRQIVSTSEWWSCFCLFQEEYWGCGG